MVSVSLGTRGDRHRAGSPEIEIKTALGGRIAQALLLGIGGFIAVLITIALMGRGTPWAALAAASLVVWIAYHYRLLSMAVVVRGDELEARNLFSTHRIHRASVGDVSLGESSVAKSPNQTVVIRLSNGRRIPLDACARTQQSRRKRRRVEDFQRRLAHWSDVGENRGSGPGADDSQPAGEPGSSEAGEPDARLASQPDPAGS
jgi:hypothetical protein